jgi:hypothetical protein
MFAGHEYGTGWRAYGRAGVMLSEFHS